MPNIIHVEAMPHVAETIAILTREGWEYKSVLEFVKTGDISKLVHTGYHSRQLCDPKSKGCCQTVESNTLVDSTELHEATCQQKDHTMPPGMGSEDVEALRHFCHLKNPRTNRCTCHEIAEDIYRVAR